MKRISDKRGVIISALASGMGKTVVAAALGRCLLKKGVSVGIVKLGPDYIDRGFHSAAIGGEALNLDLWAMSEQLQEHILASQAAELTIFEGMMGLFDGRLFSTADAAKRLGLGIILILDVGASAQTPIHIAKALASEVNLVGVILNRVRSGRHLRLLKEAAAQLGVKVLGELPSSSALRMDSRHLGLVQAAEVRELDAKLDAAAELLEERLDLAAITAAASPLPTTTGQSPEFQAPGKHVAVARDRAFSFTYPWFLAGWRNSAAAISYFSPLADQPPPEAADFIYLPGGYPELYPELGRAKRFFDGLRRARERGAWIYGECGGFMVLGESITVGGRRTPTAGLLKFSSHMDSKLRAVDYRQVRLNSATALGAEGSMWRGHEFRYATTKRAEGYQPLFISAAGGECSIDEYGIIDGRVFGSFIHLIDSAMLD